MFLARKIIQKIKNHLPEDEISIITRARQTGKTVILKQLREYLEKHKKQVYFINLEDLEKEKMPKIYQKDIDEKSAFEVKFQAQKFNANKYQLFYKHYPQIPLNLIGWEDIEEDKNFWPVWVI